MTLKEAKKILKKEFAVIGLHKSTEPFEFDESRWIEHEKPSVLEAFRVLSKEGYYVTISGHDYNMREERLKKEYEENTKAPGSGEEQPKEGNPALAEAASQFNDALLDEQAKQIDEQNKEITRLLSLVEKKENSISRLYYEKSVLEKENEDLKKGEIPARYFDKALVDEQEEKIKKLEHEKLDILEIASSSKQTISEQKKKIKRFGKEIARLNNIIHKKNEELRLTKIREKNLTEVCQKYVKENEELKKKLADKIVDKIDARALKSAESALAYKEKVIAEKDDVIADLGNELAATKKELEDKTKLVEDLTKEKELLEDKITIFNIFKKRNDKAYQRQIRSFDKEISDLGNELAATKKELEEKTNLVEMVRKGSKEYREYGIAALSMIRKMAKVIVNGGPVSSKDYKEYIRLANGYSFNPQLPGFSEEEEKKLSPVKNDNSHGDVTNQKDISPSLKVTLRLLCDDVRDLFKNIQHLWQ